jgi:hypothetical protein
MTTASNVSKKNRVALGFVSYFVCMSLLGLAIYRWSQPIAKSQTSTPDTAPKTLDSSGAVVSYESLDGSAEVPKVAESAVQNAAPEVPAANATETSGSESTSSASTEEDWN